MDAVRLHFPEPDTQALHLSEGSYGIGRHDDGLGPISEQDDALIKIHVDQRGIWMNVSSQSACVHVNGRRIYQIAFLRSGDVVHLDSAELRLTSAPRALSVQPLVLSKMAGSDPRQVLRALGGPDHGRCFTLDLPCLVGRSAKADLHIDDPACNERHAWLEWDQDQVLLRHLEEGDHSLVNGQPLHKAVLAVGDQVAFTSRHRFVLEAPDAPTTKDPASATPFPVLTPQRPHPLRSLIWLLAAATLLAASLAGVLLFGTA